MGLRMKILIIEEETAVAGRLKVQLEEKGFAVKIIRDGETGLDYALSGIYDLVILDADLPGLDGYELTRKLRQKNYNMPIVMLSAECGPKERVYGLTVGADYHLAKEFDTDELLSCVYSLICRQEKRVGQLMMGNISLDLPTGTMLCGRRSVHLSQKRLLIMRSLMRDKNDIISKERLLEQIREYDSGAAEGCVGDNIFLLRKNLSSIGSNVKIMTFRGLGYCLEICESDPVCDSSRTSG